MLWSRSILLHTSRSLLAFPRHSLCIGAQGLALIYFLLAGLFAFYMLLPICGGIVFSTFSGLYHHHLLPTRLDWASVSSEMASLGRDVVVCVGKPLTENIFVCLFVWGKT